MHPALERRIAEEKAKRVVPFMISVSGYASALVVCAAGGSLKIAALCGQTWLESSLLHYFTDCAAVALYGIGIRGDMLLRRNREAVNNLMSKNPVSPWVG